MKGAVYVNVCSFLSSLLLSEISALIIPILQMGSEALRGPAAHEGWSQALPQVCLTKPGLCHMRLHFPSQLSYLVEAEVD